VAQNPNLFAVFHQRAQRVVSVKWWFGSLIQFDIVEFGAPDDAFLSFSAELCQAGMLWTYFCTIT
jgi:hypothetical protein